MELLENNYVLLPTVQYSQFKNSYIIVYLNMCSHLMFFLSVHIARFMLCV